MANSANILLEQALYDGAVFEVQIIPHFIEAAVTGILPNNKRTNLPLVTLEEIRQNYEKDYSKWAQGSHRSLQGSPSSRVKDILAPEEDPFRIKPAPAMSKLVKSRVWEGISLISTARWLSKRLDNQENVLLAMEYIRLCINPFHCLHRPIIQGKMRSAYNRIYNELMIFQDAINVCRAEKGETALRVTALWAQFIKIHFEVMAQVARFWIFMRLASLRAIWKGRITDVFLSGRQLDSTQRTVRVDHLALAVFRQLIDLGIEADKAVRVSTLGFKEISVDGEGLSQNELMQMHTETETQFRTQYNSILNTIRSSETDTRRSRTQSVSPEFFEQIELLFDRERAHRRLQPEIDIYSLALIPEPWINYIKRRRQGQFSFVAYRISYKETDQEWDTFIAKLNASMDTWSGVAGSEVIKENANLQWIDGRQENIAEGDLQGVRKHFKKFTSDNRMLPGMEESVCIAIDAACVKSHNFKPSDTALRSGLAAEFQGYVIAVDSSYEAEALGKSGTPRNEGHVKILGTLLMTDLYPMLCRRCGSLEAMWQVAKDHPWQVYVGPTVEAERDEWKAIKLEVAKILGDFVLTFVQQNNLLPGAPGQVLRVVD